MSEQPQIRDGRRLWQPGANLPRHRHAHGYVAVVVSGGYEECGSQGRFHVGPGDVLLHDAFDAHLDRFGAKGAQLINLPLPARERFPWSVGHVADVDAIAKAAAHDPEAAGAMLCAQLVEKRCAAQDWADILAADLLRDPNRRLSVWAEETGLAVETISRGFGRLFNLTPAAFRAEARAKQAFIRITRSTAPLAAIAATLGFADQAHMSRAVKTLTGQSPQAWRRRSIPFKTGDAQAA